MNEQEILNLVDEANKIAFGKFTKNNLDVAEMILLQTLKISHNEKTLSLLGLVLCKKKKFEESLEYFQKTLEINPSNPESYNNIAVCYSNIGSYDKSIEYLEKSLSINPNSHLLLNNIALQYRHLGNFEKAIEYLKKAILAEENEVSWGMLGGCYGELKELEDAEKCFQRCLILNPNFASAHVDLACIYHLKGEWAKAWPEYEWRYEVYEQLKIWRKIYDPNKLWKGQDLKGKRIIVHGEQGHGDSIHFFRYIPLLKEKQPYIILHCNPILQPLFENQVDEVFVVDPLHCNKIPEHDYHCSLVSLPYLLEIDRIPNEKYIFIDEKIELENKFNIGIVWGGNPQHPNDRFRSCHLKLFKEIEKMPNVQFYSLMKDIRSRAYHLENIPIDLTEDTSDMKIIDLAPTMQTFADTAKIINSLDLLITVDTAILHLAGALNKRTFALIPYNNDWRWTASGNKTIWYPSVELFRQNEKGNWEMPIQELTKKVEEISSTF